MSTWTYNKPQRVWNLECKEQILLATSVVGLANSADIFQWHINFNVNKKGRTLNCYPVVSAIELRGLKY